MRSKVCEVVGMHWGAVLAGEHQALVVVAVTEQLLLVVALLDGFAVLDRLVIERDLAFTAEVFGRPMTIWYSTVSTVCCT